MSDLKPLFEKYKSAVYEKDVDAFISLFDDHLRIFDMWSLWSYDSLDAWRAMVTEWFGSLGTERVVVDFDEIQETASDELSVASAFVRYTAVSAGGEKLRSLQNRLTWTTRKKDGAWKIFHEHTSAPVDHSTAKAIFKR